MSLPAERSLAEVLARFPLQLTPPWGPGWESVIRVELIDGAPVIFEADGARVRVTEQVSDPPVCTARATTAQFQRLLCGTPVILLLCEGLRVDRLGELLALQAVVARAPSSKARP